MKRGFTLIELLVVIAIVSVLATLMTTGVEQALKNAEANTCKSNLRQLGIANRLYADEHQQHFVAAASDIMDRNLQRWHGQRTSSRAPFDGAEGPLAGYLGGDQELRRCPTLKSAAQSAAANAFEASCGGYGYNQVGIGSTSYTHGYNRQSARQGIRVGMLQHPSDTIMFADTAFPQPYGNPEYLIEYSFVEPVFFLRWNSREESGRKAMASMHFRHRGTRAQINWADGHVDAHEIGVVDQAEFGIGWPGEENNALFRP